MRSMQYTDTVINNIMHIITLTCNILLTIIWTPNILCHFLKSLSGIPAYSTSPHSSSQFSELGNCLPL